LLGKLSPECPHPPARVAYRFGPVGQPVEKSLGEAWNYIARTLHHIDFAPLNGPHQCWWRLGRELPIGITGHHHLALGLSDPRLMAAM
jgi:hypothetical protein